MFSKLFGLYCLIASVCCLIFIFNIFLRHGGFCYLGKRDVITLSPDINQSWALYLCEKTRWLDMSQRMHFTLPGWHLLGRDRYWLGIIKLLNWGKKPTTISIAFIQSWLFNPAPGQLSTFSTTCIFTAL